MYKGKVYVPNSSELKNAILKEMHNLPNARHLRYHKTIADVKRQYF
jgi:phage terminase large subunit-like protein